MKINLQGAFLCSQAVLPGMMKNRWGRIINIASVVGQAGAAGQANYAASKAGLIGLTKALAQEMASRSITVNAVAPGYIATDMTAVLPEEVKTKILASVPLARMGTPDDVAAAVKFLASDDAAYITGHVLAVKRRNVHVGSGGMSDGREEREEEKKRRELEQRQDRGDRVGPRRRGPVGTRARRFLIRLLRPLTARSAKLGVCRNKKRSHSANTWTTCCAWKARTCRSTRPSLAFPPISAASNPQARRIPPGNCWSTCASRRKIFSSSAAIPSTRKRTSPGDYWPAQQEPPNDAAWDQSVAGFQSDLREIQAMAADTTHDLLVKIPHGKGQTLLREILLVADHNSYHLGQLMFLRKLL